ncbi:MAG: elongation factor P [Armatimonadetes bacterium]|nr:elongation factor P [Armatimonadota bacterium]
MISTNDLKNGITVIVDGNLMTVVEFQHVKPGKGSAFVRTKLRNLKTGYVIEKTFRAGEKIPRAHIERRPMQYLYSTGSDYVFMDNESFDQSHMAVEFLGDNTKWLKESMVIEVLLHDGNIIGVDIPNFVELRIEHTEPGFKGDTATGGSKPATLETGAVIQVPLFVEPGETVQIDTRTGSYLRRV